MIEDHIAKFVITVIVLGVIGGLIYNGVSIKNDFKNACIERGGYPLIGRDIAICLDPKVMI